MSPCPFRYLISTVLVMVAGVSAPTVRGQADDAPPAETAPSRQARPLVEFVAALRKGDTNAAFAVLDKLPETDPAYVETLTDAGRILAENRMAARALPLVKRAYRKAPNDMEVVHGYIRVHLLARSDLSEPLVTRPRPAAVPPEFRFISDPLKLADKSKALPRAAALADLDFLELVLANAYSYADRRGANWRGALDAFRASLAERTPVNTFNLKVRRFLTLFGDPHTNVRTPMTGLLPEGGAPFIPVPEGQRVLAVKASRSGFIDSECRYLAAIDGVDISEWLRVAGYDVPQASPQWQRRQTVQSLNRVGFLRSQLSLPVTNDVRLTLTTADGGKKKDVTIRYSAKSVRFGHWPRGETRRLGDLGYLHIVSMGSERAFLDKLDESMGEFRDTRGLVIDVRDNGGGSQDALRRLLPYFLEPKAPMRIINVAAYRLPVKLPQPCAEGYLGLSNRGLYPATSMTWSKEERQQIESFLKGFTPSWKLPPGRFSDWHVMGIRADRNPKAYHYTKPVVVLLDAGCFSATDNFLGALKGLPNVTLLGETSGGGSGRMADYTLPASRLSLTVCQMASFRANGDIFDGRGVAPDVVQAPKPEDSLAEGGDSLLESARARLRGGK